MDSCSQLYWDQKSENSESSRKAKPGEVRVNENFRFFHFLNLYSPLESSLVFPTVSTRFWNPENRPLDPKSFDHVWFAKSLHIWSWKWTSTSYVKQFWEQDSNLIPFEHPIISRLSSDCGQYNRVLSIKTKYQRFYPGFLDFSRLFSIIFTFDHFKL